MSSSSRSPSPEPIELPNEISQLSAVLAEKPELLAVGDVDIQTVALNATKFLFDKAVASESGAVPMINDLLKSVEAPRAPVTRSAAAKARSSPPPPSNTLRFNLTPLDSLVLSGMGPDQIWAQLELRSATMCAVLDAIIDREPSDDDDEPGPSANGVADDMELDDHEMGLDSPSDEEEVDDEDDSEEELQEEQVVSLRDPEEQNLPVWSGPRHPTLDDGFFSIDRFNRETELMEAKSSGRGRLGGDDSDEEDEEEEIDLFAPVDGLDEGDDVEEEEDTSTDEDAEDVTVDFGNEDQDAEDSGDDSDEGDFVSGLKQGPSSLGIGSAFQTEGVDSILYDDFFRPPYRFTRAPPQPPQPRTPPTEAKKPKKKTSVRFAESVRVKTIKARGKSKSLYMDQDDEDDFEDEDMPAFDPRLLTGPGGFGGFAPRKPVTETAQSELPPDQVAKGDDNLDFDGMDDFPNSEEDEEDGEEDEDHEDEEDFEEDFGDAEAIERMEDDIFAEREDDQRQPEELSTHERRMAAIAQEIKILEDENILEKPWQLKGEANMKIRPENSLLETDLEFEHNAKPAPIITEEVTKTLEDMIKSRILEGRFDDVVRQRPMDDKAFLPSKVLELDDTQSKKSLAQIYEDDYNVASGSRVDDRDGRLSKEHQELEQEWNDISYKLDALSNAHFTPKQPKATITTVTNVASTTLESALPTSVSTSTLLAPEEVFAFDPKAAKSRTEMTPAEKKKLRSKIKHERKATKQTLKGAVVTFAGGGSRGAAAAAGFAKNPKNVKEAKDVALNSLVKTGKGVTVVGKPHMARNSKGKGKQTLSSAAQLKL